MPTPEAAMNQTQAKCVQCKTWWIWKGRPLVRDAKCPECGTQLERTSSLLKGYRCANLHTLERYPEQAA